VRPFCSNTQPLRQSQRSLQVDMCLHMRFSIWNFKRCNCTVLRDALMLQVARDVQSAAPTASSHPVHNQSNEEKRNRNKFVAARSLLYAQQIISVRQARLVSMLYLRGGEQACFSAAPMEARAAEMLEGQGEAPGLNLCQSHSRAADASSTVGRQMHWHLH
jgi:hypothetical protein